jgi:hypothetical protein
MNPHSTTVGIKRDGPTDPQVRRFAGMVYLMQTCELLGIETDEEWDGFMYARAIHRRIESTTGGAA